MHSCDSTDDYSMEILLACVFVPVLLKIRKNIDEEDGLELLREGDFDAHRRYVVIRFAGGGQSAVKSSSRLTHS